MIAREMIYHLDVAMKSRQISTDECRMRAKLKHTYLGLTSLERGMAQQWAMVAWLHEGDANMTFFHQQVVYRRQKNVIHSVRVDGVVITDHTAMGEANFDHFQSLLGTAQERKFLLDLEFLGTNVEDLGDLDTPFSCGD
jgi:hypothetical protein